MESRGILRKFFKVVIETPHRGDIYIKQWEIIALKHLFSLVSIYLVENRNANI